MAMDGWKTRIGSAGGSLWTGALGIGFSFVVASFAQAAPASATALGNDDWTRHGAPVGVGPGSVSFQQLPIARTPQENQASWQARAEAVAWGLALRNLPEHFTREGGGSRLPLIALARFEVGYLVEETNRAILDPSVRIYAKTGTDFHDLGKACAREGDYDFALRGWMPLLYRFWNRPEVLWPQTRAKILHELSPERGNGIQEWRFYCGVPIHETENHILMTEGSQLLTNALLNRERVEKGLAPLAAYDNEKNGMNAWARHHLTRFLRDEFEEFNSRPYQPYAMMPLWNLAEYAEDPGVRLIARSILDFQSAKFVASSQGLRRLPPFRRQAHRRNDWEMMEADGDSARMLGMTGAGDLLAPRNAALKWDFDLDFAIFGLLGNYRLPSVVERRFYDREQTTLQRFSHFVPEIYARFPGGLISGGGVYRKGLPPFRADIDAVAMPTTLIPEGQGIDGHELVRIEGHQKETRRSNLCVAPGFACGTRVVIPESIPAACRTVRGPWTFLNLADPACPVRQGLWVAVYQASCDSRACRKEGSNFGFFEARRPAGSFTAFVEAVMKQAGSRAFVSEAENEWVTQLGHHVRFQPVTASRYEVGIRAVDSEPIETDWRRWLLAEGDILRADRAGRVEFVAGSGALPLIVDATDPDHPWRTGPQE